VIKPSLLHHATGHDQNKAVLSYLRRHQPDFMDEFSAIVAAGSLDEDSVAVPGYVPAVVISGV
jgi:hypothetical protein